MKKYSIIIWILFALMVINRIYMFAIGSTPQFMYPVF